MLTCCVSCGPSFVDSKVQFRYLGNPSTAVLGDVLLLINVETCPISCFTIEAIDNDLGFGHYTSPLRKVMVNTCLHGS